VGVVQNGLFLHVCMFVLLGSARKNDMPCSGQPKRMMGNHIFAHFFGVERHICITFLATFLWYREAIFASHFFDTFLWYRGTDWDQISLPHFFGMERPYLHHISLRYREAKKCDANISKKNLLLTASSRWMRGASRMGLDCEDNQLRFLTVILCDAVLTN
jgi:hypothetical protein